MHQGEVIPREYLDGLLSRDNVRDALTKQFFEGNYALFDKYWSTLKEQELREAFRTIFGMTVERDDRPHAFVVYGASGYTGKLILDYIYSHVEGLGKDITFAPPGGRRASSRSCARIAKFPNISYRPTIIKADIANHDIRNLVLSARC